MGKLFLNSCNIPSSIDRKFIFWILIAFVAIYNIVTCHSYICTRRLLIERKAKKLKTFEEFFYPLYNRQDNNELIAYTDADWAGDHSDRKSTSGYLARLAGAAISWKSRKQTCTAQSTVEAEYIAAATAAKEVVWLKNLLKELDIQCRPQVFKCSVIL